MTKEEHAILTKEFFEFEVTITDSKFGKTARWQNKFHPENPNYMQNVTWYAYENTDRSKIIVKFALSFQEVNTPIHEVIEFKPFVKSFDDVVFDIWNSQTVKREF